MEHRHLLSGVGSNTARVADILDRGTLDDWRELAREVRRDPHGPFARAVERVVGGTYYYGTTILWQDFLARCRAESDQIT